MSQPPSHSTLPPYSSSGSTGTQSSFGSFEIINEHQYHSEQGGGYGSNGGHLMVPKSREQFHHYSNLPSSVKLPPSYKHSQEYQLSTQPPQPVPRSTSPRSLAGGSSMGGGGGGGMVQQPSYSVEAAAIPMSEVVRQLDFAANENMRLRDQLKQNNEILDRKLQEIETLLRQRDSHTQEIMKDLKVKEKEKEEVLRSASETTQKFFEARVAVMGFKSRQIQLQGEVDRLMAEVAKKNSGVQSSEAGPAAPVGAASQQELDTLARDNEQLMKEKQELLGRLQNGGIGAVDHAIEELRRQLSKLKLDKESLELNLMAVIEALQKDIKSLEDKRGLDQEEIQRFKVSAAELQQRVWSFQQENGTLKHQLGHQQVEMQKHIESLQNELMAARQQPQLRQTGPEITQLRAELGQSQANNISLTGRVQELEDKNNLLTKKLNEEKERSETFRQKIQRHSGPVSLAATTPPGSPPTSVRMPVPKPRTNLQPSVNAQVELLERQKADLERQLEQVSRLRTTAETELHHSTTKTQQMIEDNIRLKNSLKEREDLLSDHGKHNQRLQEENQSLRTQLQDTFSSSQLDQQLGEKDAMIRRLNQEKTELQSRVARLERDMANIKSQQVAEVESLTTTRMAELDGERRKIENLTFEVKSLQKEKADLQNVNAGLEGEVTQLKEEKSMLEHKARERPSQERTPFQRRTEIRLSEALGKVKELEMKNRNLEQESQRLQQECEALLEEKRWLQKLEDELEREKQQHAHTRRKSEQLHSENMQLKEEKSKIEQDVLQQAKDENQSLTADLSAAVAAKLDLHKQVDLLRNDLANQQAAHDREIKDLREQRGALDLELRETRSQLERQAAEYRQYEEQMLADANEKHSRIEHFEEKQKRLQEHYDQRSTENAHLHQQNEQLKLQIQDLQDQVSANEAQNQQSYEHLQSEVEKLQKENKELDVALQEYRKECESLMSDYRASAERLRETEADRDKYKNQYETALRELAQRAERIKQLEQQRKEATERCEHMSFQLKQYTEDFDRERVAREEAVKVKNIVEEQLQKKDREIASLREQLNMHARQQLQREWSGPQQGGDSGRQSPYLPSHNGPQPSVHRISGEHEVLAPHKLSRPQQDTQPFESQPPPMIRRDSRPPFGQPTFNQAQPPLLQPDVQRWQPPEQGTAGTGFHQPAGNLRAQEHPFDPPPRHIPLHQPHPQPHDPPPMPRQQTDFARVMTGPHNIPPNLPPNLPPNMPPNMQPNLPPNLPPNMQPNLPPRLNELPRFGDLPGPAGGLREPGPPLIGDKWAAPGDVVNESPPTMACPICGKANFRTQTDLELHCAQCTTP